MAGTRNQIRRQRPTERSMRTMQNRLSVIDVPGHHSETRSGLFSFPPHTAHASKNPGLKFGQIAERAVRTGLVFVWPLSYLRFLPSSL